MANKVFLKYFWVLITVVARYQLRCPELNYRLAPIEEYRRSENASAVIHLTDVRIEVFNNFYC